MIRAEFCRRLIRLRRVIDASLSGEYLVPDFFPALFSVLSYCWCRSRKDNIQTFDY